MTTRPTKSRMICPIGSVSTSSDLEGPGHGVIFMPVDALSVLCAQPTHDLFAIAKFLLD